MGNAVSVLNSRINDYLYPLGIGGDIPPQADKAESPALMSRGNGRIFTEPVLVA